MKKYLVFVFSFIFLFGFFNINFINAVNNNEAQDDVGVVVSKFNDLYKTSFKLGYRGNDVKILQQFLKDEGYGVGKVDGKYGKRTARIVKEFQIDNELPVTDNTGTALILKPNNGDVVIKPSNPIKVPKPPFDVTLANAIDIDNSVKIYWRNYNGEKFYVYKNKNDGQFQYLASTTDKFYKDISGLGKDIKYGYYVTALNSYGESAPSVSVSVGETIYGKVPKPPFDVTLANAIDIDNSVKIYWRNYNGEKFYVYKNKNDGQFQYLASTTDKFYKDISGLGKDIKYGYYVTALNSYGESAPSVSVSVGETIYGKVPKPPFDVTLANAIDIDNSVKIYWRNYNGEKFYVYKNKNDGQFQYLASTTDKFYKDISGLGKDIKYGYYVTALNSYGESAPSDKVYTQQQPTTSSPYVKIYANPSSLVILTLGTPSTTTLSWNSVNVQYCAMSGGGINQDVAKAGDRNVSIDKTTTFTIKCFRLPPGENQKESDIVASSVTVTVITLPLPPIPPPPITTLPTPRAFLTANGQSSITVNVGESITYAWSSTNADTASSTYSVNLPDTCAGNTGTGPFAWVANTISGSTSATVASCQAGRTYTIRYTTSKGSVNSVSTVVVAVRNLITPTSPLTITTPSPLPNARVGNYYSTNIVATGITIPFSWSLSGSSLPPGMNLRPGDNLGIAGTPTTAGIYNFTATISSGSQTVTKQFTLTIDPATTVTTPRAFLTANGQSSITVNVGESITYAWSSTNADTASSTYSVNSPDTCVGNTGTGPFAWIANTISGSTSATVASCQAGRTYTIRYTTSKGSVNSVSTVVVAVRNLITPTSPLTITTASPLPNAKVGAYYYSPFSATSGRYGEVLTWSLASGSSFPSGLSFSDPVNVSGIPTVAGTFTFTIRVSSVPANSGETLVVTKQFTLTIDPATTTTSGPGQVLGASATPSGNSVNLSWSAVPTSTGMPQIGVYNIFRSTSSSAISSNPTNSSPYLIRQVLGSPYVDTGLSPNTYYYRVAAQDMNGLSGPASAQVSAVVSGATETLPPVITSIEGYDTSTGVYTANQVVAGKSLVIKGRNFSASGNRVNVGSQTYVPTAESTSQVTILINSDKSAGSYPIILTNAGGAGIGYTVNLTVTAPVTTTPTPRAFLTANGQSSITVNVGESITYAWSSTNADTASSTYSVNSPDTCVGNTGTGPFAWIANTISGSTSATVASCQAGRTYTIRYTTSKGSVNSVSTVVVAVRNLITPTSPLTITTPSPLLSVRVGDTYHYTLSVSGLPSGITTNNVNWSVAPTLPTGLHLGASDYGEEIYGTPTSAGTYSFTLTAVYGYQSTTKQFTLTVNPATTVTPPPVLSGLQGYDATTGIYTANQAVAGKYIILYGTFASSGNTVSVGSNSYIPTYQSTSQINVLLGSATGTFSVTVVNTNGTSNASSLSVSAPNVVVTTPPPVLSGLQGYDATTGIYTANQAVAGKYIILYGTFASSGNTVSVGSNSYIPTYQSTSQINVLLGSATGTFSVTVVNTNGTSNASSLSVSAPNVVVTTPPPVLSGLQGYDATTGIYTANQAVAGKYIILYGTFASSGNTVSVGSNSYIPTYQSTSQINVLLGSATGTFSVTVVNTNGTSNASSLSVSAPNVVVTTPPPVLSGLQGYDATTGIYTANQAVAGKYIILYGTFASSGNTVSVGSNSYIPTYQSTSQINVLLGSATGTFSVTVVNTNGTSNASSLSVSAPNVVVTTPPPVLSGLQGYDATTGIYTANQAVAGKYIILYGTFASSGNTVSVGSNSYIPTYQSTSQINVLLGSATGTFSVTVVNTNGTSNASSLSVSAPNVVVTTPPPVLSGLQGYDATTGIYTANQAVAGKYIILYGTFASSGNTVSVGSNSYIPTYQSTSQINVLLGSATGTFSVTVVNTNGTSNASSLSVSAPNVVVTTPPPVLSGLQGYDATTGIYTANQAVAGKYIILYGTFASSGNTVSVGSNSYIPTYQSTSQINVLLGSATGTFSVTVVNTNGTSNASSLSVSAPNVVVTLPAPRAFLTANGQSYLTVNTGESITYAWSSTNADTASSTYSVNSPDTCVGNTGTGPFAWIANTISGSTSATVSSCQAGHTYTINYTASKGSTNSDASTLTIVVRDLVSQNTSKSNQTASTLTGWQKVWRWISE